ncbi:MAG: hypothetical protein JOZ16_15975 [Methylobacteriaceae bacterium]|nr:hypothetical protein [Methylobacteriaceae bacterium]
MNTFYEAEGLADCVIAYRKLGKGNYHFSFDAYRFACANQPCIVLCFDITEFFNNLKHDLLKERLKRLLGVQELPEDWYKTFRYVTHHTSVSLQDLKNNPIFGPRLKSRSLAPITTVAEAKKAGIIFGTNPNAYGIPQGTPISSALSNLYMMDVDKTMQSACISQRAMYQRYSDDIIIICPLSAEDGLKMKLMEAIEVHGLEIKDEKTERSVFDTANPTTFQYLGFNVSPAGSCIRPSSLAKRWRRMRRAIDQIGEIGANAIAEGSATRIFTKGLRRRFSPIGGRNFSSYARRSAEVFGDRNIVRQVLRLERKADEAIRELNK